MKMNEGNKIDDSKLYQDCLILGWLLLHEYERTHNEGTIIRCENE